MTVSVEADPCMFDCSGATAPRHGRHRGGPVDFRPQVTGVPNMRRLGVLEVCGVTGSYAFDKIKKKF